MVLVVAVNPGAAAPLSELGVSSVALRKNTSCSLSLCRARTPATAQALVGRPHGH